eukprot:945818-Rhodomonas_salina.2
MSMKERQFRRGARSMEAWTLEQKDLRREVVGSRHDDNHIVGIILLLRARECQSQAGRLPVHTLDIDAAGRVHSLNHLLGVPTAKTNMIDSRLEEMREAFRVRLKLSAPISEEAGSERIPIAQNPLPGSPGWVRRLRLDPHCDVGLRGSRLRGMVVSVMRVRNLQEERRQIHSCRQLHC